MRRGAPVSFAPDRPPAALLVENCICRTRAEWITLCRETRDAVEHIQFFKQTR